MNAVDLIPSLSALLILDAEGNRLAAKYYGTWLTATGGSTLNDARSAFEKGLHKKVKSLPARSESDCLTHNGRLVLVRGGAALRVVVVGPPAESELVLSYVCDGLFDALHLVLRGTMDRSAVLDSLDSVMLLLDEVCDGGKILEVDSSLLASRASMREGFAQDDHDAGDGRGRAGTGAGKIPLAEMTIGQALKQAREQLISNLGNSGGL